ncbi:MAG TPA: prolyl oligopeptidase family serine peptidase [Micromonosporaceae bacterium]
MTDASDDPYQWLEDVDGDAALSWVRDHNAVTLTNLAGSDRFAGLRDELRQVLDADERIPLVSWHGEYLYNLWRDATHPRGLWRRTTLAEYRKPEPDWQILVDLDALAAEEGENWVWQEVAMLHPEDRRCLISLSRGGADAHVVREFDLDTRAFVGDGFTLPEAKSRVGWIDIDHIWVGTDFGPGSLTSSGYPRIVKRWRRGTPLSEATLVYQAEPDDLAAHAWRDPTSGRDFVERVVDFFHQEVFTLFDGALIRVDVPMDADIDTHAGWLLIRLRSPWSVGGATHPVGALLVARLDAFLAGDRDLEVLFAPAPDSALRGHHWTRRHLILDVLVDVRTRLLVLTPDAGGWRTEALPDVGHVSAMVTDRHHGDGYLLHCEGFLQPPSVRLGTAGDNAATEPVRDTVAFFDTSGLQVRQFFATSADGTRVPYFVVGAPDAGPGPTLMTGYGGFEVARTPVYESMIGRGWLARGGRYVLANIRGGGEYGPAWHHAAMRENRPRAYEDFAAVAEDLVARGVTTSDQLGAEGRSNGGLLMGVMLTRYPHLFGALAVGVPLLDMRRYHRLLAGASWMAEYGNPDEESDWAYLKLYSPYQNVQPARRYPPVLLYTSTRDDRVHPGHARKMAARLEEYGYDVTFHENIEGGHGGAADNEQLAFQRALILDFFWRRLAG